MTTKDINTTIYTETIEDLRAKIISDFESVSKFCDKNNIDKFNLYKIFNGTKGQEMSVGLYARILSAMGVNGLEGVKSSSLSLKQYLEIDNNAILKSILLIKFT
ncbi:hypothetical protein KAU11_08960 [Candidatus Babeliales bacterium]|nr:hypothetical protein [Candidatus Babeliales bacterium]